MSINFSFPMKFSSQGTLAVNADTISAVIDDLKILLLSNHGERLIHGNYGANLRSLMFEPSTAITQRAEDLIISAIETWMPFVQVNDITVTNSETNSTLKSNELNIKLRFSVGQLEGTLEQNIRN